MFRVGIGLGLRLKDKRERKKEQDRGAKGEIFFLLSFFSRLLESQVESSKEMLKTRLY